MVISLISIIIGADIVEIYVVKEGDTVYSIAAMFGVSPQRIITDNGLLSPENLAVGQALLILIPETVHTVTAGETLYSIAANYGTTTAELLRNNPYLAVQPYLYPGETIVIKYKGEKGRSIRFSGFAYAGINRNRLKQILPYITYFIIFGYGFNEDGTIIAVNDADIIRLAHENQTAVLLSLSLIDPEGAFSSAKLIPLLTDIEFQNRVISGMINEISFRGAQGMDIDMEYIPPQYKAEFAAFVSNAAAQLHSAGYILNIDLAPKTSATQRGSLYEAHDYAALGAAADLVFLMTYEWGYQFGPPMAIAPINNVKAVLDYALTEIPADKIYLGIPNYAYDWPLPFIQGETGAQVIGNITAADRAAQYGVPIQFDENAQSPFYTYTAEDGREHIVWFEDVRSIKAKLDLVDESVIAGPGFWNFMRAFPQGYLMINNMFNIEKVYP